MMLPLALVVLGLLRPGQAPAERAEDPRLLNAVLSTSTVPLGVPFDLVIRMRVPAEHRVYFPDTLEYRAGVESAGPAAWSAEAAVGDSVDLTIRYALRSLGWGERQVPATVIILARSGPPAASPGRDAGGVVVGDWAELASLDPALLARRPIQASAIQVPSPLPLARGAGLSPPLPADVVGSSVGRPVMVYLGSLVLVLVIAVMLGAYHAIAALLRRVRRHREEERARRSPRDLALEELDELLGLGLHVTGRMPEFYRRSTGTSRRFLHAVDDRYVPALTDRELIHRIVTPASVRNATEVERAILRAEEVRFGTRTFETIDAEADLITIRDWISRHPSPESSP